MSKFLSKNFGFYLIILLCLLPVIIWLKMMPLGFRFADLNASFTSFGQLCALVGISLFSLDLILTTKLKFLEKMFYGLNNVYLDHHLLGGIAFILLLFHPLFLVIKYILISTQTAALFLIPSLDNLTIGYGIIALIIMIISMVITFYLKLPYHLWKQTHRFLGVAFFIASLHVFFVSSDISRNKFLRLYLFSLTFLGLLALFYKIIFGVISLFIKNYTVKEVKQINDKVIEIFLVPKGKPLVYKPGQFVFVSFKQKNGGLKISSEIHPFTIASGLKDNYLSLVIKSLGKYTESLRNLLPGSLAKIEGPYGKFSYIRGRFKKQVWIAGGIGITPFLSMARSLKESVLDYKIDLYYCVKNLSEAVYFDELKNISNNHSNFRIIPFFSETQGHLTADGMQILSSGLKQTDFFLCGPTSLMNDLKGQLVSYKVNKSLIHSEDFKIN
jgi:predicted ferric reductase